MEFSLTFYLQKTFEQKAIKKKKRFTKKEKYAIIFILLLFGNGI